MFAIDRLTAYFTPISLPPIFIPAVSLLGGILWVSLGFAWYIPFIITICGGVYCFYKNIQLPSNLLLSILLSMLAILSYRNQAQESLLAQWYNQPVTLRGTVSDIEAITGNRYAYRIALTVETLYENQKTHSMHESIWIYLRRKPICMVADTIILKNVKLKIIKNESFKNYLKKERISQTLFLNKNTISCIHRPRYSLSRFIHSLKTNLYHRINKKMNAKTASLMSSIFLGKKIKSNLNEQTREQFKIWGLSHYLARSGLHLVIFIMIWELILGLLPINFFIKQLLCLTLALIYAMLSWSSTSFIRALATFFIYKMFLIKNLQIHGMHVVILIGATLLLINPMLLFFVDFQLSFLFTLALSWIMQSYNDCIRAS